MAHPYVSYMNNFVLLQRGWQLRGDHNDQGDIASHGKGDVEATRHLQIILRNWRGVFSIRPTDVFHEVRIVDLRWLHG